MKKIQNLNELKNLNKTDLINEMMKGTIKGGSSCGTASGRSRNYGIADNDWNY